LDGGTLIGAPGTELRTPSPGVIDLLKGAFHWFDNRILDEDHHIETLRSIQACAHSLARACVMTIRGTELETTYNGKSATVLVFEGIVDVTNARHTVVLHADQMTVVGGNAAPTKPNAFNPSQVNRWWTRTGSKNAPSLFVSTTTITIPPTTTSTTTVPISLPLVYSNGCPGENPATFEPSQIPISCADYTVNISGLTWSSWTATGARGNGTLNVNNCMPDCAGGTVNSSPTSVTLSDPVQSMTQGLVFATVTYTLPDGSSTSDDIGPDHCVSSFNSC